MADNLLVTPVSSYAFPVSGDPAQDAARSEQTNQTQAAGAPAGGDQVRISAKGRALAEKPGGAKKTDANGLTPEQNEQVTQMRETDQRVRTHEQAHIAAGGSLVHGGASYSFRTGPDGKRYAVAGEVNIDTSAEKDPDSTIRKAYRIRSAALAPADPSSQDRAVASQADKMAMRAAMEKLASSQTKKS